VYFESCVILVTAWSLQYQFQSHQTQELSKNHKIASSITTVLATTFCELTSLMHICNFGTPAVEVAETKDRTCLSRDWLELVHLALSFLSQAQPPTLIPIYDMNKMVIEFNLTYFLSITSEVSRPSESILMVVFPTTMLGVM